MIDDAEKNLLVNYIYHNIIFIKYFDSSLEIFGKIATQFSKNKTGFKDAFLESAKQIKSEYDRKKIVSYDDHNNSKQRINKIKEYLTEKKYEIEKEYTSLYLNKISDRLIIPEIQKCFHGLFVGKENLYKLISEECLEYFTISSNILNELKRIYLVKIDSLKYDCNNYNKLLKETFDKDDKIKKKDKITKNEINEKNKKIIWNTR